MSAQQPQACELPAGSRIAALAHNATCCDAYRLPDPLPQADALATYLALQQRSPWWMHTLLALRNAAVRPLGLKTGGLQSAAGQAPCTQVGDRVGLFTLLELHPDEAVFTVDDIHLQVWLSLHKQPPAHGGWVTLSSVVRRHPHWLGKVYLGVVWPVHQRIVPRLLDYGARHV